MPWALFTPAGLTGLSKGKKASPGWTSSKALLFTLEIGDFVLLEPCQKKLR